MIINPTKKHYHFLTKYQALLTSNWREDSLSLIRCFLGMRIILM